MKIEEIRLKTDTELNDHIIQLRREIMNLRFQRSSNQLSSSARFRQARREIARLKTVARQRRALSS
jgi:large subunit ribosomal protein L29